MYNFATLLALGRGVAEDRPAALVLFRKAAELGHAKSITMVGSFYEDGWVVEQDLALAAEYYRCGAETGDFRGQFNQARFLIEAGKIEEATRWLHRLTSSATAVFLMKVRRWLGRRPEPALRKVASAI